MPVPQLTTISVYPIKSTAPISLSSSWVEDKGLAFDRRFVVATTDGQFLTGRTEPKLVQIQVTILAMAYKVSAPSMPVLTIHMLDLLDEYTDVTVWRDTISAQRCKQDVNRWFSQYLAKDCQLLFFGGQSKRRVKNRLSQVGFADGYPLLLISEASLVDLNQRLVNPVSMLQFRPNIVVSHCEPFAEDGWKHIRIGEVEFEIVKPCSRCIFTTIDPLIAEKSHDMEPIKTLKTFRRDDDGEIYFGQNLVPLNEGKISINDKVEVLATQTPRYYIDLAKNRRTKQAAKLAVEVDKNVSTATWQGKKQLFCKHIVNETHDVKTFILQSEQAESFRYQAGQHLPIELNINGEIIKRNYTLSSSPSRPNSLAITVKRVSGGLVSNYLHDNFVVGSSLMANQPAGNFVLANTSAKKILFLNAGSGITPSLSMMKWLVDHQIDRDIVFFHSAHTKDDLIAEKELSVLTSRLKQCQLHFTLTQFAMPSWRGFKGRITSEMLASIPDLTERAVFVCGPNQFMSAAKQMLLALGVPEANYFQESFGIEKTPVLTNKAVNILFDSWDKNHQGNTKDTVLEQAESAGLILPYSCRAGMCGSCKVKLESGDVTELSNDGLMAGEREQGYILACSCIPKTDLVISSS